MALEAVQDFGEPVLFRFAGLPDWVQDLGGRTSGQHELVPDTVQGLW